VCLGFIIICDDSLTRNLGCFRDPEWPWWRHPFPWWTLLFLVPLYSTCSSLSNLQNWRSRELYIMVLFSCASYAANTASNLYLPDRGDIVSAVGALVIGSLGNAYSRIWGGTAFTSMVTGVMFLVPVCQVLFSLIQHILNGIEPSLESHKLAAFRKLIRVPQHSTRAGLVWPSVWLKLLSASLSACS
jgi:uncharacterized membrane protein YjjB (DUF3815 family)